MDNDHATLDFDVAIVGYGPVGQALSALPGERDIASEPLSASRRSTACRGRCGMLRNTVVEEPERYVAPATETELAWAC